MCTSSPTPVAPLRVALAALSLILCLGTTDAPADTISQSIDFRLNSELTSSALVFDPFNPSLGTLDSISISYEATRRHAWGIWNIADEAAAVPYEVTLTDTTLTLDSNLFGFADLLYGPAVTPILTPALPVFAAEFSAGRAAFLAGLDPVFASAYQPATSLTTITGSFLPSLAFTGTLNLAYAYDPGLFDIQSDNFLSGSLVDVFGTATLTYTYQAVRVPESSLGWWAAGLGVGLLVAGRFRRKLQAL